MDSDFSVCQQAGITWMRVEFPVWPNKYMKDPQAFPTVDGLQSCLTIMRQHRMTPVLNLLQWHYNVRHPNQRGQYKEWLSALVKQLGNQVSYYEVGNEENLQISSETNDPDGMPYAWDIPETRLGGDNPAGEYPSSKPDWWPQYQQGVETYVAFLHDSYEAIKNVNTNAIVILGGISSWHSVCYLHELTRCKAYNYADAVGWHAYPLTSPPSGINGAGTVEFLKTEMLLWPAGKSTLPIWITEFGFSSNQHDRSLGIAGPQAENAKAAEIAREWQDLRGKLSIMTPIFVYTARDWPTTANDWKSEGPGGFGLFERGDPYLNTNVNSSAIPPVQLLPAYSDFQNLE